MYIYRGFIERSSTHCRISNFLFFSREGVEKRRGFSIYFWTILDCIPFAFLRISYRLFYK